MLLSVNVEVLMKNHDFETGLQIFKNAGFPALDYGLCDMVKDDNVFNGEDWRAAAEDVRRYADSQGVIINQTHTPFTFAKTMYGDERAYEDIILPRMVRSLEISAMLGAKVAVVHPLHYIPYRGNEAFLFERNMAYYRYLLPYAKEYGVKIGVENMFQWDGVRKVITASTCSRGEEFVRYIDTLDDPFAVACLDVGHVGLPAGATEEAHDLVRLLGHDRLQALHVHDNDYRDDYHQPPFVGKLDWYELAKALGEIDYTGDFTLELSSKLFMRQKDDYLPILAEFAARSGAYMIGEIEKNKP